MRFHGFEGIINIFACRFVKAFPVASSLYWLAMIWDNACCSDNIVFFLRFASPSASSSISVIREHGQQSI
jgi:hypothetical protein